MNKMSLDERFEASELGEPFKFVVKSTDPRHATSHHGHHHGHHGQGLGGGGGGLGGGGGGGGLGGGSLGSSSSTSTSSSSSASSSSTSWAFVCHGPSQEATCEWVDTIKQILQSQKDFLKAIQSPIKYQNEQQRLSTAGKDL